MEASAVAHDVLIRPVQKSWRMHLRKPIAFPKLHVVLAIHLLGSTSRRLLVNTVKLCCADHLPQSTTNTLYPHDGSPIQKGDRQVNRMSV
ncbi:hypothetical protein ACVWWO_002117 [Bradyrhizobium sp. F1.13.1]